MAAIIGFYSMMTAFFVPHLSLGAELYRLPRAQPPVRLPPRLLHLRLDLLPRDHAAADGRRGGRAGDGAGPSLPAGAAGRRLHGVRHPGRRDAAARAAGVPGRVGANPLRAFADVWRNEHSRLLIVVTFVENIGSATIGVLLALTGFVLEDDGRGGVDRGPVRVFPLICYTVGAILFSRFKLDQAAYREIRAGIDGSAERPNGLSMRR